MILVFIKHFLWEIKMGGSSYSADMFSARVNTLKTAGKSFFDYDDNIRSGKTTAKVHASLDPSAVNKAGKNVRECFDSDGTPNSVPVAVIMDVTGSQGDVPKQLQQYLPKLMGFLVKKGYLENAHIMFGGVGDATCDKVPLQIGQFESGNQMDDALGSIYLEGGGGGQQTESYELVFYYLARHTDLDSLKRGKKGYLFITGDELPYANVKKGEVKRVIGDDLESDIPLETILAEVREKFEVFWILPANTSNYKDAAIRKGLHNLFGQNLLFLENIEDVVDLIGGTIGLAEGYSLDTVTGDLADMGSNRTSIARVSSALSNVKSGELSKVSVTGIDLSNSNDDGIILL